LSGLRLYWARNDGMTGHVFLAEKDVELLWHEMLVQGSVLPELDPGMSVPAVEVAAAVEHLGSEPLVVTDRKLWQDWLGFLRGAAENGGLVVR
jgi:hypothetical protein